MGTTARMHVRRYGSAVLITALATIIRLLLDPLLGDRFPFITFFCSIVLVAWLVGLGPSLAALLLSCLSAAYFILPPRGSLGIYSQENQVGLGIFFLTGLAVALLSGEERVRALVLNHDERTGFVGPELPGERVERFPSRVAHGLRRPGSGATAACWSWPTGQSRRPTGPCPPPSSRRRSS